MAIKDPFEDVFAYDKIPPEVKAAARAHQEAYEELARLRDAYVASKSGSPEHLKLLDQVNAATKKLDRAGKKSVELSHEYAKHPHIIETGSHGGRYYTTAQGQKVYIKPNPGPEIVGQVDKHPFIGGLPATAHMQEPRRS